MILIDSGMKSLLTDFRDVLVLLEDIQRVIISQAQHNQIDNIIIDIGLLLQPLLDRLQEMIKSHKQ